MDYDSKRAYETWKNQRSRCYNKNNNSYRNYGSKKINVKYSSREFIGWYLEQIKIFPIKNPVVGRINHNEDYCFGNIKLETRQESTDEMLNRTNRRKAVGIYNDFGELLHIANSACQASKYANVTQSTIIENCRNALIKKQRKSKCGYKFRYIK